MGKRDLLTGGLMIKTSNGNAIQNPLVGTANKAVSDMVRYAAEFGMTPSARVRLAVDGSGGASSKWAGLIGGAETGPSVPTRLRHLPPGRLDPEALKDRLSYAHARH